MSSPVQEVPTLVHSVERRFYPRIAPQSPIFLAFGEWEEAMLLNVGENGLLISTPHELACNCVTQLAIPLNGLPSPVRVTARVIWSSESRKLAGIQLLDLSEHDREWIRMWGARRTAQSSQSDPAKSVNDSVPSTAQPEAPDATSLLEAEPPLEVPADDTTFAPTPALQDRPASSTARRAIIGALLASALVAASITAAAFVNKRSFDGILARFSSNRLRVTAVPPASNTQASLGTPTGSNPDSASDVASPVGVASHINSHVALAAFAAHSNSASSSLEIARKTDSARQSSKSQAHAPEDLSRTSSAQPVADSVSIAKKSFAESSALADALPVTKDSFPNLLPPSAVLPGPASMNPSRSGNTSARSPLSSTVVSSVPRTAIPRKQVLEVHLSPSYRPVLFNLPGERTLASPSVTMRIQRSVRIPASQPGDPFNRNRKVVVGDLLSHADPNASRLPIVNGADSVRVMATVAKDGTVERVRPIFGPATLIPAVAKALHQWRYQPTLVDGKPVETQCYVVIQFHEPQTRSAN